MMGSLSSKDQETDEQALVMMGDSTLDNVVWLENGSKHKCIKSLLEKSLKFKVFNYAADGATSTDMLKGACPCISWRSRIENGDPFPIDSINTPFKPIDQLELLVKK